ncbi:TetR/AcrR family transcriptional regulator [Streptomyces sp. NRRL F-5126]|uniref:TetR/AcrR family transcriptional regulator n=1 Tax=Streptomyces sp. NRRL F-5126 TaxID=1463857 RepID=UPI0004C5E572|nr:TetR/AcrR family transcriptional regulator [Streptomyces sp. NRRL F-5126]
MTDSHTGTPRERYRAQVRDEVKKHAWAQIGAAGAAALSLNAIAKRMGMSGPALYRYFANRDELITELIREAYRDLADTVRARAAAGAGLDDLAQTLRRWALAGPQRYFLIYGTPVPGYHAPEDTTQISQEIMGTVLDAACAAARQSPLPASALDEHLAEHRAWAGEHPATPSQLRQALTFWTRLHGVLSLELAGQFSGMGFDPARLYAAETESVTGG